MTPGFAIQVKVNALYKKHVDGNYIFVENVLPLQIPGPRIKWWLCLCDHKMFFVADMLVLF